MSDIQVDNSGDAVVATVTGWVDRRPAAIRDIVMMVLAATGAILTSMARAVLDGGPGELMSAESWHTAGDLGVGVVAAWILVVLSRLTTAYGRGSV